MSLDTDVILSELTRLLAIKTLAAMRKAEFPALEWLAIGRNSSDDRFAATTELLRFVNNEIESVEDDQVREALTALLHSERDRWLAVSARQADAADAYSVSQNHFRNKYQPQVLRELAESIVRNRALAEEQVDEGEPELARKIDPLGSATNVLIRRARIPAIALALIAIGVLVWWSISSATDNVPDNLAQDLSQIADTTPTSVPIANAATSPTSAEADQDEGSLMPEPKDEEDDLAPVDGNLIAQSPVDITYYCRQLYGPRAGANPISGTTQWRCVDPAAGEVDPPLNMNEVCEAQYGIGARAESRNTASAYDWTCLVELQPPTAGGGCPITAGESLPSLEVDTQVRSAFERRWNEGQASVSNWPCPQNFIHLTNGGPIQELGGLGTAPVAGLFGTGGGAVLLEGAPFEAWDRRIRGWDTSFGGFPVGEVSIQNGVFTVELESSSMMVAETAEGPFYTLVTFSYPLWLQSGGAEGCLGMPLNDPVGMDPGFFQQFERGSMRLDLANGSGVEVLDAAGAECPLDR